MTLALAAPSSSAKPARPTVLTRQDGEMLLRLAAKIRPKPRVRPSEWVEANISLSSEQSAAQPGRFRCNYLPFQRDLHDVTFDHSLKAGLIFLKCTQIGATQTRMNLHAYMAVHEPAPRLYVVDKEEKSKTFGNDMLRPLFERHALLRESVAARTEEGGRQTMMSIAYAGGKVDITTGAAEITSIPYQEVDLDEYEAASEALPEKVGDLFTSAINRTRMFRHRGRVNVFGHPRWYDAGLHRLYVTLSDQQRWVFDCPHCKAPVFPQFHETVHFARIADERTGRPDPSSAELRCPECSRPISDVERGRAVWSPRDGGSGRFESELPAAEAFARPYAGRWVVRLCDPRVSVRSLAEEWVTRTTERERMDWTNKTDGSPYRSVTAVVRTSEIAKCFQQPGTPAPGGDKGVRFVTAGIDVQRPRGQRESGVLNQHIFYVSVIGWAANGMAYCTRLDRFQSGWDHLEEYLRTAVVSIDGGSGVGKMGLSLCTIDAGDATSEVLEFCRRLIWSNIEPRPVRMLAVNYRPHIKVDSPIVDPGDKKKAHPTRTDVNPLDYQYLNRHVFVDRGIRRLTERRIAFLCPEPDDFREHVASNILVPVKREHAMGHDADEWEKAKDKRDDWLQCLVFNEVGAAFRMRLDLMDMDTAAASSKAPMMLAPNFEANRWLRR